MNMIVVGEKINATIPQVGDAIEGKDEGFLRDLALKQAAAGASFIDVNVGTGKHPDQEVSNMAWLVELIQKHTDTPLCVDSAGPVVLEAGLKARDGRHSMINSINATEESLNAVLPLVQEFRVPAIALAMDEKGIPMTVQGRMAACEKIIKRLDTLNIALENVFFDPLVMPLSTDVSQGLVTLEALKELKARYPSAKTILGLSNISFGLPRRSLINQGMLLMAMYLGLDAVIMNPLDSQLMETILTGEVITGKDRYCRRYVRASRKKLL